MASAAERVRRALSCAGSGTPGARGRELPSREGMLDRVVLAEVLAAPVSLRLHPRDARALPAASRA